MKLSALIMAGGKGTRLGAGIEKPLLELNGKFLIDYVIQAIEGSGYIGQIWSVTSPYTKKTEEYLKKKNLKVLRTPGKGYVEDLVLAINRLDLEKTLVVSADIPLLTSRDIDWVIKKYLLQGLSALSVVLPLDVVEKSGVRPDTIMEGHVPAGINIIDGKNLNGDEFKLVTKKLKFAINVNTIRDSELALRRIKYASKQ